MIIVEKNGSRPSSTSRNGSSAPRGQTAGRCAEVPERPVRVVPQVAVVARAEPREQWTRVRIDILPSDSVDHVYRISLNGETVHEESSSVPNMHGSMWVWVGGDSNNGAYQPANVTVENMILQPHT
jgi:hypothetical protein